MAIPSSEGKALSEMLDWEETDRLRRMAKKALAVIDVGGIG